MEEVAIPAVRAFRPDALGIEPGWGGHHSDILTHLQITMYGFERAAALLAAEVPRCRRRRAEAGAALRWPTRRAR